MENKILKEELVSVIIPFYNCEKYIEECLLSVIDQTYKNIEILLINDGSTDASYEIAKSIAIKDSRINIISQINSGVSKARNLGIHNAIGEYICFVDADDKIDSRYIERLIQFVVSVDIVICGFKKIKDTDVDVILNESGIIEKEKVYFNTICTNKITAACWNKIYRTKIIKENKLEFNEKIAVGEDMIFLLNYFQYCNSYYYINEALYMYRKNDISVMQNTYSNRKISMKVLTALDAVDEITKITRNEGDEIKKYVSYRVVRTSIWVMLQMIIGNEKDTEVFNKIQKNCKEKYRDFIKVNAGSRLEKIIGRVLCVSPEMVYNFGSEIIKNNSISFLKKYVE